MASPSWPPVPESPYYYAPNVANDLRPLSLGEILDRTFTIYRRHFWLFAGISAVSGLVQVIAQLIEIVLGVSVLHHGVSPAARFGSQGANGIVSILFLMATAVTSAATIYAIGEVYLGRPVTVGSALSTVAPKWGRYIGIMLWQIGSFIWLPLVIIVPAFFLIGFGAAMGGARSVAGAATAGILMFLGIFGGGAGGLIFYLRNSLGIQASVVEDLPVRPSMRRSKTLTVGTKGRIFVVLLLSGVLYGVAGGAQFPATFAIMKDISASHPFAQAYVLLIGFASQVLVTPIAMIGLSLIYFDQRIRREAFDIAFMLGAPAAPYQPPAPPVPPSAYDFTTAQPLTPVPPAPSSQPEPIPEPQPEPPPPHDVPEP